MKTYDFRECTREDFEIEGMENKMGYKKEIHSHFCVDIDKDLVIKNFEVDSEGSTFGFQILKCIEDCESEENIDTLIKNMQFTILQSNQEFVNLNEIDNYGKKPTSTVAVNIAYPHLSKSQSTFD